MGEIWDIQGIGVNNVGGVPTLEHGNCGGGCTPGEVGVAGVRSHAGAWERVLRSVGCGLAVDFGATPALAPMCRSGMDRIECWLLPLIFANWLSIMAGGGVIMQMIIDKFGRIVIPKVLRDGLHLTSGTVLEVEEKAGSLILRPFHEQPVLVRKNGFLVHTGATTSRFDSILKEERETRLLKLAGLHEDTGD